MFEQFLRDLWTGLGDLKQGQAVMVTGVVGAITLMIGHMTNAWFTGRRDRRMDRVQRRRVETAFIAELNSVSLKLQMTEKRLERMKLGVDKTDRVLIPKCRSFTPLRDEIFKNMLHFNQNQINIAIEIYATCDQFDNLMRYNYQDKNILSEQGGMLLVEVTEVQRDSIYEQTCALIRFIRRDVEKFKIDRLLHWGRWYWFPIYIASRIRRGLDRSKKSRARMSRKAVTDQAKVL